MIGAMNRIAVFSGNAHQQVARDICKRWRASAEYSTASVVGRDRPRISIASHQVGDKVAVRIGEPRS